jgi:hypothetical protein
VGIGVVPKAWYAPFQVLQIGDQTALFNYTNEGAYLTTNTYYNSAGSPRYTEANVSCEYTQVDGKHSFKVASSGAADTAITWTNAMTIDNSGNVRFKNNLENGSHGVFIEASSNDRDAISCKTSSTGQVGLIHFYNPNGLVGYIASNGTSTQYITSSDYRLKENVVPMSGSIDRLKQLKPSRFNFITDAETTVDGFLAHEAGEVVPEAISGTKDAMKTEEYEVTPAVMDGEDVVTEAVMGEREVPDMQGIDQSKLVPLLVASLQEAVARIEVLEAQLKI